MQKLPLWKKLILPAYIEELKMSISFRDADMKVYKRSCHPDKFLIQKNIVFGK
jgi:hypothetical protein